MIDIGNWLRQARYRAKKNKVDNTLTRTEVISVLDNFGSTCAYCTEPATSLDNPIPFSDGAANVQANVLPICVACKAKKRNRTICWMHDSGHIDTNRYVMLVGRIITYNGADSMKMVMRTVLGLFSNNCSVAAVFKEAVITPCVQSVSRTTIMKKSAIETEELQAPVAPMLRTTNTYRPGDKVRILLTKGSISPDLYVVEEDKNSGDIKLIRENTIKYEKDGSIKGMRVLVNSARVFPEDIITKAPVVHKSPDEAVAHCPQCGEQHKVTVGDSAITCTKHGVFELFRTKEHVLKTRKSGTEKSKKDKKVETSTQPAPTVTETPALGLDDIKALGELWTKRIEFDYAHVDARGYVLLTHINGTMYKRCFNTYNGSLGKKASDNDITKFQNSKGAYAVKDVEKAREQLAAKGYTKVD